MPKRIIHTTNTPMTNHEAKVSIAEEYRLLSGPTVVATTRSVAISIAKRMRCFFFARAYDDVVFT